MEAELFRSVARAELSQRLELLGIRMVVIKKCCLQEEHLKYMHSQNRPAQLGSNNTSTQTFPPSYLNKLKVVCLV